MKTRALHATLAAAVAGLLGCGGPPKLATKPSPPPTAKPKTKAPPSGPFWLPLDGAPTGPGDAAYRVAVGAGTLLGDRGGARWLISATGEAQRAETLDQRVVLRAGRAGDGLWAITDDGRFRTAASPLAKWEDKGTLPSWLNDMKTFGGGATAQRDGRVLFSTDLSKWSPVQRFEGRRVVDAVIDQSGTGIALFEPQAIGITTDGGKTFTATHDPNVFADKLAVVGDRVLVLPGGVRDGMARAYRVGDDKLAPALVKRSEYTGGAASSVMQEPQPVMQTDAPMRFTPLSGLFDGTAAIDGDTLVIAREGPALGRRWLGAAAKFADLAQSASTCSGKIRVAACGGTVVAACERGTLLVIREGKPPVAYQDIHAESLGFVSKNAVVVVHNSKGTHRAYRVSLEESASPRKKPIAPVWTNTPARVVGSSCAQGRLWIAGKRWQRVDAEGNAEDVESIPSSIKAEHLVGLDENANPVFVHDDAGKGGHFFAWLGDDLSWEENELPFTPTKTRVRLASMARQRGMLLATDGLGYVTTDKGKSWKSTGLPALRKTPAHLVCGASGCEIEHVAYSKRWDGLPAPIALRRTEATTTEVNKQAPPKSGKLPTLSCKPHPTLKKVPVRHAQTLHAGLGGAVATTFERLITFVDRGYGPEIKNKKRVPAREISVFPDGRARRLPMPMVPIGVWPANVQQHSVVGRAAVFGFARKFEVEPMTWHWGGARSPRRGRKKFGTGLDPFSSIGRELHAPDGMGLLDEPTKTILLLRDDGTSDKRELTARALSGNVEQAQPGALVELKNGDWVAAAIHPHQHMLDLVRIAKDGVNTHRTLRSSATFVALAVDADQAYLVLDESDDQGARVLRSRLILADFRLGAPTELGQLRAPNGAISVLPACTGPDVGALVYDAFIPLDDDDDSNVPPTGAQLRVQAKSVCTRRLVMSDHVVMGDGNGVGAKLESPDGWTKPMSITFQQCQRH